MKKHFTFYLILVGFFCFLSPAAIGQTTRFVSTTGVNSDPASATSWATATSDLQGAINSLTATGGEVWVASGLYKPTSTTNRTISWDFYENINVYGGFVGSETAVSDRPAQNPTLGQLSSTTLSGDIGVINDKSDNSNRLIAYHGTTNFTFYGLIDGFVLTGADGGSGGGAIMVGSTGSLVVSNCYFYQNSSGSGGAISMYSYEVGLVNCVFESNSASGGGGAVFSTLDGTLSYATFISCIFRNNSASEGGAIYALYSLRIRRCLFENNTATTNGGAISTWTSGCNVNARNCSFVNNSAGSGGGAINSYSSPFMSVPAITGCSFQGNSATTGGAIRHNISSGTAVPTISNSVFYNNGGANTIDNGAAITLPWKYNLAEAEVQSVTGITTQAGNLTATTTPFASTVSNELYGCSPAIDAGDPAATNSTAGSTDISLQPRFYNNGRLDIGAYEYQADPTTITLTNPAVSNATVGVGFSQTFTASGGTEPYSYSLLNSSLPTGLTLSTTGVLSGTSTKSGTFTMVLQTTDGMGCGAIGSVYSLTVDPVPPTITGFAASPAIVCVGQATTFTAIIGNVTGSYGFTLTNGSSPISGTTTNSTFSRVITNFVTGTKTYTLIVNDNGSFTTATTTLTINNFSPLTITASPSLTITQGNTITLTASGSNSGETLVFTWPDGSSGATYVDIPASTIAYSLTGLNTSGCLSATSVTITVISPVCYSVIYVTQNGGGLQNGSSWANAYPGAMLQTAINAASSCSGQVWVATGIYKPTTTTGPGSRTVSFAMRDHVAIYGGFLGNETAVNERPALDPTLGQPVGTSVSSSTLSGDIGMPGDVSDNSFRILSASNLLTGEVLDGFVISGANANVGSFTTGAAINLSNSSPAIRNCVIENNTSTGQGAAANSITLSQLNLDKCLVRNNHASISPIYMLGGTITNSIFQSNTPGAVSQPGGTAVVMNCQFLQNSTTSNGGAVSASNTNTVFRFINCSFVGNQAGTDGSGEGGVVAAGGGASVILYNCSFLNNSAPSHSVIGAPSSVSLVNCVLFNNGSPDNSLGSNVPLPATNCLFETGTINYTGNNNLTTAVSPFASTTSTQLNACAPPINAGSDAAFTGATSLTVDLADNPRFYNGGTVDMGAYEFQATPSSITLNNPGVTTATVGSAFSQTFTVANGTDPSTFTLLSGSLPTGLTLASTGVLSGTPTQSGTFTLVVQGTDAGGCMNTGSTYTLTVGGLPPTLSGFAPTVSTVCTGQITTFTAIIGNVTGSYDFTLTNGTSTTTGTTSNTAFSQSWTAGGYGVQSFSLIISTNGSFATASTTLTVGAVISNAAINYWGGCISSDWQTASNWSKGHVPTASEDVALLASAPNQPILSSAGVANSVDVPASTTLTIGNSGNLTINGSGTANTGLRVTGTFQNSGQLTIDGTTTYGLLNVPGAPGGTVANSGTITVGSSASAGSYGVYNLSNFTNNSGGLIRIDRADEGLTNNNSGTFTNAGAITIGASALIGQFGLKNLSTFNNIAGSSIAIDRVGNTGLYNAFPATFTNSSSITIGASASIGSYGLYNSAGGRFNNATGGQISITNSLSAGLYNTTSSIFSNSAVVTIGASGSAGQYGLHNAAGNFVNTADGQVSINRASITGLYNSTGSGTITNSGTIAIGNLASVGQYGISSNGLFSNTTGGLVQIDNTSLAGYFNSSSSGSKVYNSGTLTIGASVSVGQYGIRNENIFDNELGGQIRIDRSTGAGLYTTGIFSNSANITIGASASVGQYGLQSFGSFTNSSDGQINIDNSSSVGLAHLAPSRFLPFINSGTITIGANAAVGSIALSVSQLNTVFTNNAGGLITLARSTTVGLGNYLSTINNAGTIRVGTIAGVGQYGLQNELAYFNNLAGGIIYLDGTTDTGLLNKHGAFTNSSTILIGSISSVGATGVSNETALLNNSGCAALLKVVSDAVITNSASGTFTNTGTIIENAGGNSSISSNAGLVLNQNDGTFTTGTGPNTPLSITGTAPTVCSPANGSFTLTGLQANTTYSLSYTLNGTPTTVSPDPVSDANGQFTLSGLSGGVYIFSLSGSCVAEALPLSATLTSPEQLTITTQPAAMSVVCAGVSVYASIGLSGTATSYQWYKDGVSLGISQTAVTLSLTNVQISDAGNYSVVATGDCNSATSTAFSLTVNLAPSLTVTANPSLTITSGNTVTLTVSGGINYTWTGNVQSATFTASPIITTTYSVTGNTSGCTSATSVTVTVNSATPTTMGFTGLATSVCSGNPVTFTATVGNITGSYDYTLTNGSNSVNGSSNSTTFSQNWITSGSGLQTFTLTVNDNGASTTALTTLTVNALPSAAILTPTSTTLTCTTPSLSLTATGGGTYQWEDNSTSATRTVSISGTYSVTVTAASCTATASVVISANQAPPTISISPSSATLTNATPTASLSAIGSAGALRWSTGETASVISVSASGTYSVTITSPGGCTASASVPIAGADLTLTLTLPQANFASSGSSANFLVDVFEVGGLPTSAGNVTITITAPVGYSVSFINSLTSIIVTGGSQTPVSVDNVLWTVTHSLANRQLTLVMNSGQFIGAGHQSSLGFQITRTTANSGSTASITVNVADDLTMSYDGNLKNNVYARIISGL